MSQVTGPGNTPGTGPGIHQLPPAVQGKRGENKVGTYTAPAGSRDYRLYTPSGYEGQMVPLVVMLHGCSQTPAELSNISRMNSLAEEHTFLVLYPEQASSANRARCWNWYRPDDQKRERGEPAIIAGLTRKIMSRYAVDPGRVYVAGISAGGAMAAILAATYPDLFAAVGVHSGVPYCAAHNVFSGFRAMRQGMSDPARHLMPREQPGRVTPLIIVHGDSDRVVNKINAEQLAAQWLSAFRRDSNGKGEPVPLQESVIKGHAPAGHAYTRTIYCDVHGREVMEKWIIHEAGHAWVGSGTRGPYADPLGPNASAEMVRFFLQHSLQ